MINEFFLLSFLKRINKLNLENENFYIKLSSIRNFKISKEFIGLKLTVYNGNKFIPIRITEAMINKKFGLFAFSKSIILKKKKNKYFEKTKKK
jgi:ribosomal protein S19